jgi:hypothetical protein
MIPARGWLVVVLSALVLGTVCARARAAGAPVIHRPLVWAMVAEHGEARFGLGSGRSTPLANALPSKCESRNELL